MYAFPSVPLFSLFKHPAEEAGSPDPFSLFFFFCCNRTLSHAAPVIVESGADGRSRWGGGGWREGRRPQRKGDKKKKREAAAAAAAAEHQKQYGLLATLIRGVWLEVKGSGFPRHQRRAFGERPRLLLSPPSHSDDRAGGGGRHKTEGRPLGVIENQRQPVIAFF